MYAAANPLGIGLVAAGVTTLLVTILLTVMSRPRLRRVEEVEQHPDLPHGAEAALTSVIEAIPDPRNVLALTRDLSGEVRITDADRADYAAMLAEEPVVERQAAPPAPAPALVIETEPVVEPVPVAEPERIAAPTTTLVIEAERVVETEPEPVVETEPEPVVEAQPVVVAAAERDDAPPLFDDDGEPDRAAPDPDTNLVLTGQLFDKGA
jgi:hypothetical protein